MNALVEPRHIKLFLDTIHCQPKEKQNTILEPIQSMITLALLSYYPKGTKLAIYKNNLLINEPTRTQGVIRWYYKDGKEDVYLLFNVIKRFLLYHNVADNTCYNMLRIYAVKGIQCLIETYESDKASIIQTLKHYQFILNNYTVFQGSDLLDNSPREQMFCNINVLYDKTFYLFIETLFNYIETEKNTESRNDYIKSLLHFMKPKQDQIHKWIQANLIYT